jgi:hypothetical protein
VIILIEKGENALTTQCMDTTYAHSEEKGNTICEGEYPFVFFKK